MPYNVTIPYDLNIWNIFLDSVKLSIRSSSGMGFYILAFIVGLVVVKVIASHFANSARFRKALEKRSFARNVFEADMYSNLEELVDDGVRHKKLGLYVNQRMRDQHSESLIDDQVESSRIRQLSKRQFNKKYAENLINDQVENNKNRLLAKGKFNRKHVYAIMEDQIESNKIRLTAKLEFGKKYGELEVLDKVHSMEVSHAAKMAFAEAHPDAYETEKDLHMKQADEYYKKRGGGKKK